MRFLVLGAGALGGYFGGMLIKGGADVTFLVRPARAAQLRRDGLIVKTQDGGELRTQVRTAQQGQLDGTYDVVLLSCKAYDLDGAMDAIAPAMSEQSVIVPVLNGVRHIDVLKERFGRERVLGGLTVINAALMPDGAIQQSQVRVTELLPKQSDASICGLANSRHKRIGCRIVLRRRWSEYQEQ